LQRKRLLAQLGYEKVYIQHGAGPAPKIQNVPIEVASFDYMRGNPWKTLYENADLIISHAGAGSCLEALENRRRLLVVINESLMDNHQIELACALKECNYLEYCYPQTLTESLDSIAKAELDNFEPGDPRQINHELRRLFCL